jgi:hypothetical protein
MRDALRNRNGQRMRIQAKIIEYGASPQGSKYLIGDVRDAASAELLTDHPWMEIGSWASGMRKGDVIAFDATVEAYRKGYLGRNFERQIERPLSMDFHLVRPANEIIEQGPIPRIK